MQRNYNYCVFRGLTDTHTRSVYVCIDSVIGDYRVERTSVMSDPVEDLSPAQKDALEKVRSVLALGL